MAARNRRNNESFESAEKNGEDVVREGRETSRRATLVTAEAMDVFNGPIAKMVEQNRMIFQKMLHAMHEESLRFVNRRLEHTSRAIESSRDCQGVTGIMAVQQEWLMDIARDYAEQTKRFSDLIRDLAEDGMTEATAELGGHPRRSEREHSAAA